jgi:hypothetical protein
MIRHNIVAEVSMFAKFAPLGGALLLIASCSTPQYEAAKNVCAEKWYKILPRNMVQRQETEYRTERRFTGAQTCETRDSGQIVCKADYIEVEIPYSMLINVDLNKPERDARIKSCTRQACSLKYGNTTCETEATN